MGVYACEFMCLSGSQRPTSDGVSMELYTLFFLRQDLPVGPRIPQVGSVGSLESPRDPLVSASPVLGLQVCATTPFGLMQCLGWNLDSQTASSLPTDLFPSPPSKHN